MLSFGAFAAPVYVADPNKLLFGRRKLIFKNNDPRDIKISLAPRKNTD